MIPCLHGPHRVAGRIDQAEQIHAALVAASAEARLATTAPQAVAAATGRDGTDIDVLSDIALCAEIKKRAPTRPVLAVVFDDGSGLMLELTARAAESSRGPDARIAWPATGAQILAACQRAVEAAPTPRPRLLHREILPWALAGAFAAVLVWAAAAEMQSQASGHRGSRWARAAFELVMAAAAASVIPHSRRLAAASQRPWDRFWVVYMAILAVGSLVTAIGHLLLG